MLELRIDKSTSPWLRASAQPSEGESLELRAGLSDYEEIEHLKRYTTRQGPFMALDGEAPIFNGEIFSRLTRVSAIRNQERTCFGELTRAALQTVQLVDVATFLIESHVIETFAHVESRIRLLRSGGEPFRAFFEGSHIFYTNERNEVGLSFAIEINEIGEIYLESA